MDRIIERIYSAETSVELSGRLGDLYSFLYSLNSDSQKTDVIRSFVNYSFIFLRRVDINSPTFCNQKVQIINSVVSLHYYFAWRIVSIGGKDGIINNFCKTLLELVDLFGNKLLSPQNNLLSDGELQKVLEMLYVTTNINKMLARFGKLQIAIFDYSMIDFNGLTRFYWNNNKTKVPFVLLLAVKKTSFASPLFVLLHEIAHCFMLYLTGNEHIVPIEFESLRYDISHKFNELSSIEWFAELFSLFVVNIFNYKEHIPRCYSDLNCERLFCYFSDVLEVSDVKTMSLLQTFQNTITKQLSNIKKGVPIVRCPDNYVGSVNITNNIVHNPELWFCRHLRINNHHIVNERIGLERLKGSSKTIVIILESPHIDEYDNAKCKIAPAPALGTTGYNLDDSFVDKLNDFMTAAKGVIEDGIYQVILMNAIQFQCSLGLEPIVRKIRDENFLSLWASKNIVENFKQRLEKYRPDIIINCCTNGEITKGMVNKIFINPKGDWAFSKYKQKHFDITGRQKYFLYGFVQNAIDELNVGDKVEKLRCTHPSSWRRNKDHAKITKYQS